MNKKTLVIGASENTARYSNAAIRKLRQKGYEVVALGRHNGTVGDVAIQTGQPQFDNIHTITVYMSAKNQQEFEEYMILLKPQRIIFNPGAQNKRLAANANSRGIETPEACTLVMLSTKQY